MIFLDTSAIYALADRADPNHKQVRAYLRGVLEAGQTLITHNYVLVESMALLQRRLGLAAAVRFARDAEAFEVVWVDESIHSEAVARLEKTGTRGVSLVDAMSFLVMRKRGIRTALAFDADFVAAGFRLYEASGFD
jgi:predicted nucleic acid-binding protein